MSLLDPVAALRAEAEATDHLGLPPDEREARLAALRDRENHYVGAAQRRIQGEARSEEGREASKARASLRVRALALLREAAVRAGVLSMEEADGAGLPTLRAVDELAEEGLLSEAVVGIAKPWKEMMHPRGRGGKFRDVFKPGKARAVRPMPPGPPGAPRPPGAPGPPQPPRKPPHPAAVEPDPVTKAVRDAKHVQRSPAGSFHESNLDRKLLSLGVPRDLLDEIKSANLDSPRERRRQASPLADKLLGRARDTEELYTDPLTGQWDPKRKELHDKIVDQFLRERRMVETGKVDPETGLMGKRPELCADCPYLQPSPDGKKVALFTAGGNASGKSTALSMPENEGVTPESAVDIDFDAVKQLLPEFQEMSKSHDIYGTDATHFESAHVARRILDEAEKKGLNVVVDASGDSSTDHYEETIRRLHDQGYETTVVMVDATLPLAVKSMLTRAAGNGRYVPLPIMARVHHNSVAQHTRWRTSDAVDRWRVYHRATEGHGVADMKLVAEGGAKARTARRNPPAGSQEVRTAGKLPYTVLDPAGYESLLSKVPGATFDKTGHTTGPDVGRHA